MERIYKELIELIGEDITREGLIKTPSRASKAMRFLTSGYGMNIDEIVNNAIFHVEADDFVIVKDIEFYSMCEHHLLPFFGVCSVGYLPKGKVLGLSKIPRIVEMFSRRLQIQENLTKEIATEIKKLIDAEYVVVEIRAKHMCMMMRGVQKNCDTITKYSLGKIPEHRLQELSSLF